MHIGNDRITIELTEGSALDIGSCRIDGVEIAPGTAVPDDGDARILRAVGGFMFTCGPEHVRHPEAIDGDAGRRYPLHGSLSGNPARIVSDNRTGNAHVIEATVDVATADGGQAKLARRWTMDLDTGGVSLQDRMVNAGHTPFVPMLMYHMNVGAHLFDDNTRISGPSLDGGGIGWMFGEEDMNVFCVPAVGDGGEGAVTVSPIAGAGGRSLVVRFSQQTLPHLQMWRNQAGHCNVLGIEPVSHPWMPRADLAARGLMAPVMPGGHVDYHLSFQFV